jgi:hypothetical protein
MTDNELAAIKARVEAATPGPWEASWSTDFPEGHTEGGSKYVYAPTVSSVLAGDIEWGWVHPVDADFIASARADVPALLAEIDRLKAERQPKPETGPVIADRLTRPDLIAHLRLIVTEMNTRDRHYWAQFIERAVYLLEAHDPDHNRFMHEHAYPNDGLVSDEKASHD